ncbi:MAG TPA: ABC transporter permease, partial [Solirubrobacteraceae bacterium]
GGDYLPSVALALLIVALSLYTNISDGRFLASYNLHSMLLLATALAFVSLGQAVVLMVGGIDLSVGPLMGVVVVITSFFWTAGQGTGNLILGIAAVVGAALAVGLTIGVLVRAARLSAVLATIAVYIVLQGVGLLLRPQEGGFLTPSITGAINTSVGWMPVAFLIAIALTIVAEIVLRRTRAGLALRAVGSDEARAHRLGARVNLTHMSAYVICSLLAAAGGVMLAAQLGVGDGDPTVGVNYTLQSVTAVVLGGASIFGGRGSFVGALLGATLLTEVVSSVTFLQLSVAWNYWLPGLLILVGAGIFSRARGGRAALIGGAGDS